MALYFRARGGLALCKGFPLARALNGQARALTVYANAGAKFGPQRPAYGAATLPSIDPQRLNAPTHAPGFEWASVPPNSLERLGDAVFTMKVRTLLFWPPRRPGDYAQRCVDLTRAETQSLGLQRLSAAGLFSADEEQWLQRGRNSSRLPPQRLRRYSHVYRDAGALECLVGYLFLTDPARLDVVLSHFFAAVDAGSPACSSP